MIKRKRHEEVMRKSVVVGLQAGLEANLIAHFVQKANQFSSNIYLELGTKYVNAKSIMGIMGVPLVNGAEVIIRAEGSDEEEAVKALEMFLTQGI